jgi:hypothetical protein
MATLVRLTEEQIERLMIDMQELEKRMKDMHEELVRVDVPKETLAKFSQLHDRYTSGVAFLLKQRELGKGKDSREQAHRSPH